MEEEKIPEPKSQARDYFGVIKWQWQSDFNPRDEENPFEWNWRDYSDSDCFILEKAFLLNEKKAILRNYEVDLGRMLQVHKKFSNRIRRVRRQVESRFMMEMPELKVVTKEQKTMNEAFGTLQHFLDYLMKRTREADSLNKKLTELDLNCQSDKFQDVIEEVIYCIKKGAAVRERAIKAIFGCQRRNYRAEAQMMTTLIVQNSSTLRDFLKSILKIYTLESFICYWLNELLRSENWEEINILAPYLVCLVYAFKLSGGIMEDQAPKGLMSLFGYIVKKKLYLYRGASLTKEQLELYDPTKTEYFSWNGVISTSRDPKIADKFAHLSLAEAQERSESRLGVIFKIEMDFGSRADCEGMIDVSKTSRFPHEREVILAPGTVFKVLKVGEMENSMYEISLRVMKKFNKKRKEISLLGALHKKAVQEEITGTEELVQRILRGKDEKKYTAVIDGLPSERSLRLLGLLRGNELISKIEISNSEIEEKVMKEIENTRVTTGVKKKKIKLKQNTISVSNLSLLARYFSAQNLNEIFLLNKIRFKKERGLKTHLNDDEKIENVALGEEALKKLQQSNQINELWEKMKNERQLKIVKLAMKNIQLEDEEFENLFESLQEFQSLEGLYLGLNHRNTSQNLGRLCKLIESSKALQELYLEWILSDVELSRLQHTLLSFDALKYLLLNFRDSNHMTNEGLCILKTTLKTLGSLRYLSLGFAGCSQISDEGLKMFIQLNSLQSLSLGFQDCQNISDEGINHLIHQPKLCTSLQELNLEFSSCGKISNTGLLYLKRTLISLVFLQHLLLGFTYCKKISDAGLIHLQNALQSLTSLNSLSLGFGGCKEVSEEGLKNLESALQLLTCFKSLSVNISRCSESNEKKKEITIGNFQYSRSVDIWNYPLPRGFLKTLLIYLQNFLKFIYFSFFISLLLRYSYCKYICGYEDSSELYQCTLFWIIARIAAITDFIARVTTLPSDLVNGLVLVSFIIFTLYLHCSRPTPTRSIPIKSIINNFKKFLKKE